MSKKGKKKFKSPLLTVWNIIGTLGGIISLSSLAEDWAGNIIEWKGFLLDVFSHYEKITAPVSSFLVQILPIEVGPWAGDYLIFGITIQMITLRTGGAFSNGLWAKKDRPGIAAKLKFILRFFIAYSLFFFLIFIAAIFWPIQLVRCIFWRKRLKKAKLEYKLSGKNKGSKLEYRKRKRKIRQDRQALHFIAATLLVSALLISESPRVHRRLFFLSHATLHDSV